MTTSGPSKPRGHWPKGKRRHAHVHVAGWPTLPALLRDVRRYCRACQTYTGQTGRHGDLARYLGVHHSTLSAWLSGRKWPSQRRANQIARWYRKRTGRKARVPHAA